jgi:serine/threonine protein kinase
VGNVAYVLLEYTPGATPIRALAMSNKYSGPQGEESTRSHMEAAATAVQFIHDQGFIHGAISPDTIWHTPNGQIRIGDYDQLTTIGTTRLATKKDSDANLNRK